MNFAFFGKTMENIRDRVNQKLPKLSEIPQIFHRHSMLVFKGVFNRYETFTVYKFDKERI